MVTNGFSYFSSDNYRTKPVFRIRIQLGQWIQILNLDKNFMFLSLLRAGASLGAWESFVEVLLLTKVSFNWR